MPKTDILKLIFHHDQRLDNLAPSENQEEESPLSMFTNPDPTYSTLYFSGTDLENKKFGINTLRNYSDFIEAVSGGFKSYSYYSKKGVSKSFEQAVESIEVNEALVVSKEVVETDIIHSFTGKMLRDILEKGWIIIFKREAKDGFDLQIFSKKNIYTSFFYPLQSLLPDTFRFFSINGKRLSNEKQYYFETWKLENPPHGFEEVFPESIL